MGKLTTIKVRTAKPGVAPDGKPKKAVYPDGDGLLLWVKPTGARFWVLRVQVNGKRRDIGLGSVALETVGGSAFGDHDPVADTSLMLRSSLTLAEARKKAAALRELAKAGANPIAERDKERRVIPTFAEAVTAAHEAKSAGHWAERTAKAFLASLIEHANPKLGAMRVDAIAGSDIVLALAPIWNNKPVMARKVRARILQVLAFAKGQGWRTDALPDAREMRGGLSRQEPGKNFAAMPFAEVPDFVADQLGKERGSSRMALLFAILTAARSGEVRSATWAQIDFKARTWSRSAADMKMGVAHVVTLSDAAIAILEHTAPEGQRTGLIFPGSKQGRPLSDMSLTKIMRLAGRAETVHGFRSAFRDWAAEEMPTIPADVAEKALAHSVGTATEKAYLRSDLREMRRALMDAWGRFAAPSLSPGGSNVIELGRKTAGAAT
ncbi:MAG: integrase arm-type DNA-binding domain-containing protein [Pseudomonadota bacterium]